jgi:Xaa-Pro aminopeptidase
MCGVRPILWLACAVLAASAQSGIPKEEYRARRAELRKALPGVVALYGRADQKDPDETLSAFRQDPSFLYLTGWEEPGAILLLWPQGEALFLPPHDERLERYAGRRTAAEDADAGAVTGFREVLPAASFEARRRELLERHSKVYTPDDVRQAVGSLRMKKSPQEVGLIQEAIAASVAAHRAAWKRVRPGIFEYQVQATFVAAVMERGCRGPAYAPLVASGPNALVLHYWKNTRRMVAGELLLLDAAAECSDYAADMTRTLPVSGKFTPRQRELYEIVLGAEKAVLAAVKPGVMPGPQRDTPNSLYKVAYDYLDSHGKDLAGNSLGKYLLHGVSHHVGLRVHDPGAPDQPLEPGMVITVEPGIYIPEEGLGIRIEDMVLVTERGAQLLTGGLPKEAAEVERALARP